MSTNIVYFNLRLRVAGMYASLTKSNKKKKTPIKEESVGPPQIGISQCDYRLPSLSILAKSNPRNNNCSSYLFILFGNFCPTNHTIKCTQKI